jgi:hypothetical protein
VKWESCGFPGKSKGDDSLRSFLFTVRNPHGVPPRKFPRKEDMKSYAICCNSNSCAEFGYSPCGDVDVDVPAVLSMGISVSDICNANKSSFTCTNRDIEYAYVNTTGFEYVFTGEEHFTVKEIEVFEIVD